MAKKVGWYVMVKNDKGKQEGIPGCFETRVGAEKCLKEFLFRYRLDPRVHFDWQSISNRLAAFGVKDGWIVKRPPIKKG